MSFSVRTARRTTPAYQKRSSATSGTRAGAMVPPTQTIPIASSPPSPMNCREGGWEIAYYRPRSEDGRLILFPHSNRDLQPPYLTVTQVPMTVWGMFQFKQIGRA